MGSDDDLFLGDGAVCGGSQYKSEYILKVELMEFAGRLDARA